MHWSCTHDSAIKSRLSLFGSSVVRQWSDTQPQFSRLAFHRCVFLPAYPYTLPLNLPVDNDGALTSGSTSRGASDLGESGKGGKGLTEYEMEVQSGGPVDTLGAFRFILLPLAMSGSMSGSRRDNRGGAQQFRDSIPGARER